MKKNNLQDLILTSILAAIIVVMTFVPQLGYITVGTAAITLIPVPVFIGVFLLPLQYSLILGVIFGGGSLIQALPYADTVSLNKAFINPLVSVIPRLLTVVASYYIFKLLKTIETKVKRNDVLIFAIVIAITVIGFYYAIEQIIVFTGWNANVVTLIGLLVIVGFIVAYYAFLNTKREQAVIPSALILSSFAHTLLVLIAVLIFEHDVLAELLVAFPTFAASETGIILVIASTNGVAETLFAAVIGTPIIIALQNVKKRF